MFPALIIPFELYSKPLHEAGIESEHGPKELRRPLAFVIYTASVPFQDTHLAVLSGVVENHVNALRKVMASLTQLVKAQQ